MAKIQKNQLQVSVSNGFVDEGDGLITFPAGLTITDGSTMRSGTRYDIPSLDISNYPGQLTADHVDSLGTLIGKVQNVQKQGDRVFINGIKYAVNESAYARLAYDLLLGGFSNSFSIETMGPWPDEEDNTYYRHELVGLSQVVVPNNYNAKTNQFNEIVHNSLERSQQDGLNTEGIENQVMTRVKLVKSEAIEEESMTKDKKNNDLEEKETPVETPEVKPEDQKTEVVETEAPEKVKTENETPAEETKEPEVPAKSEDAEEPEVPEVEVKQEAQVTDKSGEETQDPTKEKPASDVSADTDEPEAPAEPESPDEPEVPAKTETEEPVENQTNKNIEENLEMTKEEIAEIVAQSVAAALKPMQEEVAAAKEAAQNALDVQAKEPEFTKEEETPVVNALDGLSSEEVFSKQLNAAVAAERMQSVEARKTLNEINARNLQALKDEKIVNSAMTLEDLGNFVIAPELYNQIVGVRTNYQTLIDATQWRETNSLEFAWLSRTSDIDMQPVAIGALGDVPSPDTTDNRLKPVSIPTYGPHTDKLEELAAVTPISINVIKFAAADILADVAEGYRNDYDKKRAQLIVARLQQAVNTSGQKYAFDISDGLIGWARVASNISDATTVGTLIMNNKSLTALKGQALDNYNGSILAEISNGTILGIPFIVVPNDLLPTLNTNDVKHFNVQGVSVTVDQAVFYGDLRTFTGRSSGGLKYDVDGSASYEVDGTVYSAYQRNEIVLRGSFFRGGVVKDPAVIASIPATAVS